MNLDVQGFVFEKKLKFDFLCQQPFLSALFTNLQFVYQLMQKTKVREATYFAKILLDFLESNLLKKCLDYRLLHIDRDQQKYIVEALWKMMTIYLHNYKDGELLFYLRRLYHLFFFEDVPFLYRK